MAYPVFDLHCDTADRIGWATLDLDLRFTAGTDGYFPGDETSRSAWPPRWSPTLLSATKPSWTRPRPSGKR